MKYWYQRPHPSLSDYIRTVLVLEGFSQPDDATLPLFTNAMSALLCRAEKDENDHEHVTTLALFGKSTEADNWEVDEQITIIAYFFKPFALTCLFNLSMAELLAAQIDLSSWSPHKANALKTQLSYAGTTSEKVAALHNLMISQLEENKRICNIIRFATDELMRNSDPDGLAAIPGKLKLSERTFQRLFKKYVGITANQYRRICQFESSFTQVKGRKFEKLTDVAFDNGFADQSHFIRSFREFVSITPNTYLRSGLKKK